LDECVEHVGFLGDSDEAVEGFAEDGADGTAAELMSGELKKSRHKVDGEGEDTHVEADVLPVELKTLQRHSVGVEAYTRRTSEINPNNNLVIKYRHTAARYDTSRAHEVDRQLQRVRSAHNFEHRIGSSSVGLCLDLLDRVLVQVDGDGTVVLGLLCLDAKKTLLAKGWTRRGLRYVART
jgi:hypothetical protein